jgi:hypothetical protein
VTTDQIEKLQRAQPFRPFTLHLADGTKHRVTHPELISRMPGGRTLFVSLGGEKVAIVDLLLVTKITKGEGGANGGRQQG